jgi:hypothetical protein
MLTRFFYTVREAGIPVSLTEYLSLLEALEARVAEYSVDDFYYLARTAMVKDEKHFDRFDLDQQADVVGQAEVQAVAHAPLAARDRGLEVAAADLALEQRVGVAAEARRGSAPQLRRPSKQASRQTPRKRRLRRDGYKDGLVSHRLATGDGSSSRHPPRG